MCIHMDGTRHKKSDQIVFNLKDLTNKTFYGMVSNM